MARILFVRTLKTYLEELTSNLPVLLVERKLKEKLDAAVQINLAYFALGRPFLRRPSIAAKQ